MNPIAEREACWFWTELQQARRAAAKKSKASMLSTIAADDIPSTAAQIQIQEKFKIDGRCKTNCYTDKCRNSA